MPFWPVIKKLRWQVSFLTCRAVLACKTPSSRKTPSDVRRLCAARLNVEATLFSLGIDTETFRCIPPFDKVSETLSSRHGKEEKSCEAVEQIVVQSDRFEGLPKTNSSRHGEEEEKSFKVVEQIVVERDSDDDLETIGSQQQRRFKRLKHGPLLAEKAPLSRAHDSSIFARRRSNDVSECITQLYKEPLPFGKNFTNKVPEGGHVAGIQFVDYIQERFQTIGPGIIPCL